MSSPDESTVLIDGPWTHRSVPANGVSLHVAEAGSGPLVLLLHGMPTFWWTFARQLQDLADAGFRAVAVDLRGYGASDKPPRGYDATTLAADIAALIPALGEQDAVVVGNDVGGLLAWTVAAQHPKLVRRIAVLGAAHPLRLRRAVLTDKRQRHASAYALQKFQLPRYGERMLNRDDALVRSLFDTWSGPRWRGTPDYVEAVGRFAEAMRIHPTEHCSLEFFRWAVRSLPRPDGRTYAATMRTPINAPVLQLHGDFDGCVLPKTAQGSSTYVRGDYEWRLLTGVGHFPQQEVPETVSAELIRWAKAG
ncbi:alpha/beta hydrolase [Jatrophihabitans telluris]|uniref:Alpha/beta hydrolase n=1 Tax=Jatrophihabitans telluris TaxID=2038343 RepID=A0ABY4QZ79_9ACTN|nr:alpha/beta hydrolase [Jatrophihabitans telluris]UQX88156.1 alpha/beta hydrolase [Jatrophihabitans telluris]